MNESLTISLELPAKVLQPNCTIATMGGRFMKAKATKRYRIIAFNAVVDEDMENAMWEKASCKAVFYHKNKRRRDEDNAKGSLKAAFDGVVDAGLLPDDESSHLTHEPPEFKIDKMYPRVELTFTRIA
jgi:crossover junction endodeoxyribonuclease RusA